VGTHAAPRYSTANFESNIPRSVCLSRFAFPLLEAVVANTSSSSEAQRLAYFGLYLLYYSTVYLPPSSHIFIVFPHTLLYATSTTPPTCVYLIALNFETGSGDMGLGWKHAKQCPAGVAPAPDPDAAAGPTP
jgi:hypothetical protein